MVGMSSRSSEVVQRIDAGHTPDEQAAPLRYGAPGKTFLYAMTLAAASSRDAGVVRELVPGVLAAP
jgi:hypothetical protein